MGPGETRGGARPLPLGCAGSHLRVVTKVSKILFSFSSLKGKQKHTETLTG